MTGWRAGAGLIALWLLRGIIHTYRFVVSPLLGARCRFTPGCSSYALQALEQHGLRRGFMLALRRIFRCHPWGGMGYDPVPPPAHHSEKPGTHQA